MLLLFKEHIVSRWTIEEVEEAIIEVVAVIVTAIADAAEAEAEDTVTNPTTTTEVVTITIMVAEEEDVLAIDLVPVRSPSKIRKQPCSVRYIPS